MELTDFSRLGETEGALEDVLRQIATATAQKLQARRCSIQLVSERESDGKIERSLRVIAHHGNLPPSAYQDSTPLALGVAGTVILTGKPLSIPHIGLSPFRSMARYPRENPSFLSAPLRVLGRAIGVINVSLPESKPCFDGPDLEFLELFAQQAAHSLQIFHLQRLVRSRFVAMAVRDDLEESRSPGNSRDGEFFELAVPPHPEKLARIVARSFFKELTRAGFNARQVIEIATEVLNLLQRNLDRHRNRLEGRD